MKWQRNNFIGGLNLQYEPTRIGDTEYPLVINGRNREGTIRPVKKHLKVDAPAGKYQGLYAANEYMLLALSGKVYVRNFTVAAGNFNFVDNIYLNPDAETVWAEMVPVSNLNFARTPSDDKGAGGEVLLKDPITQSLSAVVLQDGNSDAYLLMANGQGRRAGRYGDWAVDAREYVPKGKQMLYHDGILYIVSPNGNEVYRSIRGRPLDFMINITYPDGDKLSTEAEGGASTVSHSIGFEPITCLGTLNSPDNAFYVGTLKRSVKVIPSTTDYIFGDQPRFANNELFPTGPNNQFSFVESNGDNLLVNPRGMRSFNAALQMRNRGDNAPISRRIKKLFRGIRQSATCAVKWDDYVLFAVNTIYGWGILVYDETIQQFAGLDIQEGVGQIKQFAVVTIDSADRLFFITADNQLYEAYADTTTATCQAYVGEFCSQDAQVEFQPTSLRLVFVNALEAGTVTITPYINAQKQTGMVMSGAIDLGITEDTTVPYSDDNTDGAQQMPFDWRRGKFGWKVGILLSWNCDAELSHISFVAEERGASQSSAKAEAKAYVARK